MSVYIVVYQTSVGSIDSYSALPSDVTQSFSQNKSLYELSDTIAPLHDTYFWYNEEQTLIKR